jgi:hypothetical protein
MSENSKDTVPDGNAAMTALHRRPLTGASPCPTPAHPRSSLTGSGRGGTYAMMLFDESATAACGGRPARLAGSGSVSGNDF